MSDIGEQLLLEFQEKSVIHRGNILLPPRVALEFVQQCRERGVELLGFDAFRLLSDDHIQPVMEDSIDLSSDRFARSAATERLRVAESFLCERLEKDIVFEMVTG